jgi:hypothetical protein
VSDSRLAAGAAGGQSLVTTPGGSGRLAGISFPRLQWKAA